MKRSRKTRKTKASVEETTAVETLPAAGDGAQRSRSSTNKAETPIGSAHEPERGRNNPASANTYYPVLLLIAAVSIWIRTGFPVHLLSNSLYDDGLFLRTARFLKAGDWLGPYDKLTLAKGMFYPLFIAAASTAHIPLKTAEQAAYLVACALAAELVRRRAGNHYLALAMFGLLAFNPVLWTVDLARVIREGLYVSLSLAIVALTVVIAFPTRDGHRGRGIFQCLSLGFIGGAFWLTREEGIWLLPALSVVVAVALIGILRPDWIPHSERVVFPRRSDHFKAIALPFALAIAVFLATDVLVAGLNYKHYGIFETNEFRAKSFLRAYGAMARIQHDEWQRYIVFPRDARQRAYSVSPAARELTPFFEGPLENAWRQEGCKHVNIVPCSDVPAGWFMWELRDAVSLAGHSGSTSETMRFYGKLADEIDAGCARRSIDCLSPRATLSPPFRREYLWETVRSGKAVAKVLFTLGDGHVGSAPSVGGQQDIQSLADFTGSVYPTSNRMIQGWAAAVSEAPKIKLVGLGPIYHSWIAILPAQDLVAAYPDLKVTRFQLETDCPADACDLIVQTSGRQFGEIPIARLRSGARFNTTGATLRIETNSVPDTTRITTSAQVKIATIIARGYAIAFPMLAIFGVAGLVVAALLRGQSPIPASLLALGLGSLAAVATRIALLAYIDASSFPTASTLYTSPASPFVIIFIVVGVYAGGSFVLTRSRRFRDG
ncbi:MAG: hypothetical protein WCC04_01760 [Terriglobales bacterium]